MARVRTTVRGRASLARDSQQWMLDYLIQETGKVFHFQGDGSGRLPRTVRSHDMISKHSRVKSSAGTRAVGRMSGTAEPGGGAARP